MPRPPLSLRARALVSPLWLVCAGCAAVGPDYAAPEVPVPDAWEAAVAARMAADTPDIEAWWESLRDPALSELVRRAAIDNLELGIALQRVLEARALLGIARGARVPSVTADGQYSRAKSSENAGLGELASSLGGSTGAADQWSVGASAAWEIDVFGRVRRSVEAAVAQYEGSIEDHRDLRVILLAEVGLAYVDVRAFQARLRFARQNAEAQRESLGLTEERREAGLTSELDVAQAEQNLAQTESIIPSLEAAVNAATNRLSVLLGEHPGALDELLAPGAGTFPVLPADVLVGVPAEILRRRPDLRSAERGVAAATAQIGVAEADLYPTFSLSGFVESVAGSASDLTDSDSFGWGIVPGFRWDLFRGGAIRSNVDAAEARAEQALLGYRQAILLALAEVDGAMVSYDREVARRDRLRAAVDASERAVELVRSQYRSGLTNFQNLLDAQRSLFQQQDALADSEGLAVQNLILLNRALGGGWVDDEDDE